MTSNQDSLEIVNNSLETNGLFNKTRINSLTKIFQTIRGKATETEILQMCVAQVHQVIKCDRAVVYSLLSESQGKIVAEALTPGFSPTINSIIKDPCFEARYVDLYQKGRVRVIDNIYEAGMSSCYVENLEKIEVKANLVVPLNYTDDSVFGLLVMHQCSAFRQWEIAEVNFAIQIAGWAMEQISDFKKYARLQTQFDQTVGWQNLLQKITHDIHEVNNCDDVLQVTVDRVREILQCDRAVIYGLQDKIMGKIVAESTLPNLDPIKERIIKDPCFEYRFIDKYRQGRARAIDNIYQSGLTNCYVENLEKISVKSNLVVPINWQNGELFGLLVVHQCFEFRKWQDQELDWLQKVGLQTGLSLSRGRLEAELHNLKSSNNSLKAAKEIIKFTKIKTQKIGESLQNFNEVLSEVNNLNRILNKEVDSISQSGLRPEKEEIKVMQTLVKKMTFNIEKLKKYRSLYQTHVTHMKDLIDEAVIRKMSN